MQKLLKPSHSTTIQEIGVRKKLCSVTGFAHYCLVNVTALNFLSRVTLA